MFSIENKPGGVTNTGLPVKVRTKYFGFVSCLTRGGCSYTAGGWRKSSEELDAKLSTGAPTKDKANLPLTFCGAKLTVMSDGGSG
jgi:hypothetical protein